MGQEPGTEVKIQDFCRLTYAVKFPMFEKTMVKKDMRIFSMYVLLSYQVLIQRGISTNT